MGGGGRKNGHTKREIAYLLFDDSEEFSDLTAFLVCVLFCTAKKLLAHVSSFGSVLLRRSRATSHNCT